MAPNDVRRTSQTRRPVQPSRPVQTQPAQPGVITQAANFYRQNREQVNSVATRAVSAANSFRAARDMYRGYTSVDTSNSRMAQLNRARRLAMPVVTLANNARRLPGQVATASRDIRTAIRTGRSEDLGRANQSTRSAISTSRSIAEAAPQARRALRVGMQTAERVAPRVVQTLSRPALRLAETSGARIATRIAARTAATSAARVAGRAAGRFVPGANIAIAAIDTVEAVRTLRDPNAGAGRKITSVITAAGSIAAATNIPVVSQIGAGVSTVSSIVGEFFR